MRASLIQNPRGAIVVSLCLLFGSYSVLVFAVALFQRHLIYFPAKLSPESAEKLAAESGFLPWRNNSGQIIGWKMPAGSPPVGSILIAHGNAGYALDRTYFAIPIHRGAALDVYILEYPGYGARPGSPNKNNFYAAADDALQNLPANLPLYLVSESLGAGVITHLAQKYPARVAGLAFFAPYDNLASVAQSHFSFLPAGPLLRDRFDPAADLEKYRGPAKFVLAGADEIIPVKFGQRLHDGYAGSKSLQIIPGARHNEIAEQPPEWWGQVLSFWREHPR